MGGASDALVRGGVDFRRLDLRRSSEMVRFWEAVTGYDCCMVLKHWSFLQEAGSTDQLWETVPKLPPTGYAIYPSFGTLFINLVGSWES